MSVRGSGTGLTGGAVAYPDGLVVSLAAMDQILGIDPANRLADVQAGVVTAEIDRAAAAYGLMYAPDPASYGESTIGGNIATNAGGLRCVKYGVTADSVAGLEVVLASGDVITDRRADAEGRGGLRPDPAVRRLGGHARRRDGGDGAAGAAADGRHGDVPRGLPDAGERGGGGDRRHAHDRGPRGHGADGPGERGRGREAPPDRAEYRRGGGGSGGQFIGPSARVQSAEVARLCREAGALSVDEADGDILLEARRVTGRALSAEGLRVSSDVAVPIARLAEMFTVIEQISREEGVGIPTFAHAGDGNLHPSVIVDPADPVAREHGERILDRVSDAALALGGTLSGEHGIGSLKHHALSKQLDPPTLAAHRLVKDAFDPNHILSPGRAI